MKLINNTKYPIGAFIYKGVFNFQIQFPDKNWVGGAYYRGGGPLDENGVHFDVNIKTGLASLEKEPKEKMEFAFIPENEGEAALLSGMWLNTHEVNVQFFSCVPYPRSQEDLAEFQQLKF